jgi:hypothetical protein
MCLSMSRHAIIGALCVLSSLFYAAQERALSSEVSYVSFEVPGALGTYPMSINDTMSVTGYYFVSATVTRGFLRDPDGVITTFDVLGGVWTEPEAINSAGNITGFYEGVVSGVPHGFVRYVDGHITTFDVPNPGLAGPQAQPISINDFDDIAGNYAFPLASSTAFTRSRAGVFNTFGSGYGADYQTVITGLNANGSVVGFYTGGGNEGSFLVHPDGFTAHFSVPVEGESNRTFNSSTIAESINGDGVIAGWYINCMDFCVTTSTGGFVRSPQGQFTLFDPPGTLLTLPRQGFSVDGESLSAPHRISLNLEGSSAGSYTDSQGAQHGFVRTPSGTITSFDPPKGRQTTATSMNDGGVVAGFYYYDWNAQIPVGFLRLPKY